MLLAVAFPAAIPSIAAVPGDVKDALPALTVMLVNGGVNVLIAVLILIAGWLIARWIGRWVHDLTGRSHYIDETLKPLITNFVRYGILAVTVVAVLSQFGVQTTSLIAVLGAAGLAIGLAIQGTLSNVASGVMLLFLRPFRVFDKIKLADTIGTVREIGLFRTEIITDDGTYVSIPNATVFSGTIINVSHESMRRTSFTVEVDRSENLDAVQKIIREALERQPRVQKTPPVWVEVESLGPLSTTLTVHAWLQNRDFLATLSDMKKCVRHALNDAGTAAPIPVGPPSVAPWQPPVEQGADQHVNKPN
ncbi:MAG TPA: mechanosensitive ion channel domain-containing protein [Rhizomicrobium sp.]|nr:mechanosensitive ion channel domain-containing protein [Rhizomicrobium sp.]